MRAWYGCQAEGVCDFLGTHSSSPRSGTLYNRVRHQGLEGPEGTGAGVLGEWEELTMSCKLYTGTFGGEMRLEKMVK